MDIQTVRKKAGREEIDYPFLLSMLEGYTRPRDKISDWLESGDLIRIKKGIYVFGERIAQTPFSHEILANLIYGPSAISLGYALSLHGLIPERVTTITSITPKRNKSFATPAGTFTYRYLELKKYPVGIEWMPLGETGHFLMAGPEKALCDLICLTSGDSISMSHHGMHDWLIHDQRLYEEGLHSLRVGRIKEIATIYQDARIDLLALFLKKFRRKK